MQCELHATDLEYIGMLDRSNRGIGDSNAKVVGLRNIAEIKASLQKVGFYFKRL